jgi:hypothetical protein
MASYDEDRVASEAVHQADHKASVTPADHVNADVNHYKRLLIAGAKYGVRNGAYQALEAMGVVVQAPAGTV